MAAVTGGTAGNVPNGPVAERATGPLPVVERTAAACAGRSAAVGSVVADALPDPGWPALDALDSVRLSARPPGLTRPG
ncbi:hypothetical protein [Streptomyces turgidiscabies]|uniref:Uncharacterized protein n=1 Tax=Streptomyces turgidiscabies TaxID=85558 RepID=A0ABU0RLN0_9ACTN|nr:hypothetical protein [Streptomyces turgidiscabies]MDQ0932899.1 hypothetical protein [Streptomyces turgidiscabies]